MYIKQLEIDNFKSFANKSEIPLLKGFTTVSGPNGSGKSNIIDSVLFALGLANASELRAENLSHFISTYTKRNEAFVKVTFGETENGEDLTIGRKIRKTSQGYASTYYINDSVTTLTNVHAILEKYNVTPNSYNVMMQGDVMGITNCSPKNRRKIIDEIAGIADFDRRIEQATNELETVEQRVERSTVILNEVDNRLEQLKEEREVALKYQKLREEKQGFESQINKVRFFDIKRNLEKAHENILEFTKKKKEEEAQKPSIVAAAGPLVIGQGGKVTTAEADQTTTPAATLTPATPVGKASADMPGYTEIDLKQIPGDVYALMGNGKLVISIGKDEFNMTNMTANAGGALGYQNGKAVAYCTLSADQPYEAIEKAETYTLKLYAPNQTTPSAVIECKKLPSQTTPQAGQPRTYVGEIVKLLMKK